MLPELNWGKPGTFSLTTDFMLPNYLKTRRTTLISSSAGRNWHQSPHPPQQLAGVMWTPPTSNPGRRTCDDSLWYGNQVGNAPCRRGDVSDFSRTDYLRKALCDIFEGCFGRHNKLGLTCTTDTTLEPQVQGLTLVEGLEALRLSGTPTFNELIVKKQPVCWVASAAVATDERSSQTRICPTHQERNPSQMPLSQLPNFQQ